MPYKGVVKDKVVVLEEGSALPEGMRVIVTPEIEEKEKERQTEMEEFIRRCKSTSDLLRAKVGITSDSVEHIRQLREERGNR